MQASPWILRSSFGEVEELVETSRAWDVEFRQIDPGRFDGRLDQAAADGVLLSVARFSRALDQTGCPPSGLRTFVIPMRPDMEFHWRGHRVHGGQIAAFPRGSELRAVSRPGFHIATLSISEDRVDRLLRSLDRPDVLGLLDETELLSPPRAAMRELRRRVRQLMSGMTSEGLAEALPEALFDTLVGSRRESGPSTTRSRDEALRRVSEYLDDNPSREGVRTKPP